MFLSIPFNQGAQPRRRLPRVNGNLHLGNWTVLVNRVKKKKKKERKGNTVGKINEREREKEMTKDWYKNSTSLERERERDSREITRDRSRTRRCWIATRALFNRAERRGILRAGGWTRVGKRGRGARKREGKGEGTRGLVWVPRAKGWMDGCECNCLIGETAYAVIDETVRAEAHPSPPGVAGRRCPLYVPSFRPLTGQHRRERRIGSVDINNVE